jgi:hypothetical protein
VKEVFENLKASAVCQWLKAILNKQDVETIANKLKEAVAKIKRFGFLESLFFVFSFT